jgi:hypothetical protein
MHALATRPGRLALGIAVLTAAALGTVSASAAQAAGTSTATVGAGQTRAVGTGQTHALTGGPTHSGKSHDTRPAFAVAYHPTADAPDDVNSADEDFAACMREQGQSVFPRFHASKDDAGHIRFQVRVRGDGFDPTSASYKKALKACGPIMEKAGVTFPEGPALPPPGKPGKPGKPGEPGGPGTPGKPGKEGPSLHTEKAGADDAPGLTAGVLSA